MTAPSAPVVETRGLGVELAADTGAIVILDGIDLAVGPGEILGIVGESGAGKSMTGSAIIRLLDPPLQQSAGEIRFEGRRIDQLGAEEMRRLRGAGIGMIFQDPLTALNPVFTIGRQLVETIREHGDLGHRAARRRAVELLAEVGIPSPQARLDSYPHEFSGGMRQRAVIALALAGSPRLVIADEPTTSLDVSIQAQIIALLTRIAREIGAAVILISHDMGVIAEAADRVAVMYAGRIVEIGLVAQVLRRPRHPYTVGLIRSIPEIGARLEELPQIPGAMPRLDALPSGCAFHPRCDRCIDRCRQERPELEQVGGGGVSAACWVEAPP